jgi:hypothetical protein
MHKIIYLFLLFSIYSNAQVIPIGTVIKGKRLPTLFSENVPHEDNSSATLYGSIKINDSKLSIVENGFVILLNSDPQSPNISNARQVIVSGGTANFQTTLNDFVSNTSYKYRAYAKNSKGEYAYSQIITFTTFRNYCAANPCKNVGVCTSTSSGPMCKCTISFCGDCCAQLADPSCPGGGDQTCTFYTPIAYADEFNKNKFHSNIIKPSVLKNAWVNTGTLILDQSNYQSIVNTLK